MGRIPATSLHEQVIPIARCGCTNTCTCSVVAGTGTTVTGTGSAADPYVINATGAAFQANDTNTVDHTLTGTGTAGDPFILSSQVIVDPVAGELITTGPAGIAVTCESVQDCVGQGFINGLEYLDGTNQFQVRIDPAPTNTITQGPAGLLAAGGGITTLDTPCINLTGDGTPGTPLQADPIISPVVGNNITCTPQGLFVPTGAATVTTADTPCIAVNGDGSAGLPITAVPIIDPAPTNTLTCGPAGLLVTPAPVVTALCGLEGNGTVATPLAANVGTWAFPCDQSANATDIYCDPVSGQLQGEPPQAFAFDQQFVNSSPGNTPVPAGPVTGTVVGLPLSLTVNNPSPCRTAYAVLEIEVDADFDLPAGGGTAELMIDADVMWRDQNFGNATKQDVHTQGTKVVSANVAVPPGGSVTVTNELRMRGGAGGATYDRTQLTGRMWVKTI